MRAAIGIVRVSKRAGREGESFISPQDQRGRIEAACERDGIKLSSVVEEIDVSGGTALEERAGLREAIEAVEAGEVQVVVVGYFDRLFRSLSVQAEVVSRVEKAGGEVLALDFGRVSEETAAQWLSGTVMGAFAEYYRRSAAEKSKEAQRLAVQRGVPPFPAVPLGLQRRDDGRLEPSADAALVVEAFQLRAEGEPIEAVRTFLAERGARLTYRQTQGLLGNRLLIGEIHFGALVNAEAHEAVVPRDLFMRVQRVRVPRGAKAKSDRLLARLGVLRCGNCGSRMIVGHVRKGRYPFYRCASFECRERMTISAEIVEGRVVEALKELGRDETGRASAESEAASADAEAERAQADLDAAIRAFAGLEGEGAAKERLEELVAVRDEKVERAEHLRGFSSALVVSLEHWDQLTLGERRDAIRAKIRAVRIQPGRGVERVLVEPRR